MQLVTCRDGTTKMNIVDCILNVPHRQRDCNWPGKFTRSYNRKVCSKKNIAFTEEWDSAKRSNKIMVVNMGRNTVSFFIDVHNATIRNTCWRKHMPSHQPSNDHLKERRYWIHNFTSKNSRRIAIFILSPEFLLEWFAHSFNMIL